MAAIKAGKDICLANKETLIAGGPYVLPLAREHGVNILPADSEHSVRALPAGPRSRLGPVRHPVCMCWRPVRSCMRATFQAIPSLPDGGMRLIFHCNSAHHLGSLRHD